MTEYVKVPKHLLERLELHREGLYELLEDMHNNSQFSDFYKATTTAKMVECTSTMWELANRKWEKCND